MVKYFSTEWKCSGLKSSPVEMSASLTSLPFFLCSIFLLAPRIVFLWLFQAFVFYSCVLNLMYQLSTLQPLLVLLYFWQLPFVLWKNFFFNLKIFPSSQKLFSYKYDIYPICQNSQNNAQGPQLVKTTLGMLTKQTAHETAFAFYQFFFSEFF